MTKFYKKPGVIVAAVAVLLLIVSLVLGALVYDDTLEIGFMNDLFVAIGIKDAPARPAQNGDGPDGGTTTTATQTTTGTVTTTTCTATYPDADQYFNDNSTVLSRIPLSAEAMSREMQVLEDFVARGFTGVEVTSEYDANGNLMDYVAIATSTSAIRHPIYQAMYKAASGDVWVLTEIGGVLMATPLSYNATQTSGVPVVISERNSIMSFDSQTKTFYENIPHDTVLKVITVERIDAETLANLTVGAIDAL